MSAEVKHPEWFIQFATKLKAMRTAQKKFFQCKGKTNQYEAMRLEKEIDDWITRFEEKGIIGNVPPPSQTNLFNNG